MGEKQNWAKKTFGVNNNKIREEKNYTSVTSKRRAGNGSRERKLREENPVKKTTRKIVALSI